MRKKNLNLFLKIVIFILEYNKVILLVVHCCSLVLHDDEPKERCCCNEDECHYDLATPDTLPTSAGSFWLERSLLRSSSLFVRVLLVDPRSSSSVLMSWLLKSNGFLVKSSNLKLGCLGLYISARWKLIVKYW